MKKRKILAMLMVAALSAGMLAGCGSDDTKEESKSTEADTKENTEENKDTEETKEESTEESADQPEGTEEEVSGFTDGSGDGEGTDETADDTSTVLDTSEPLTGLHHAEIEVKDYGTIKVELDADTADGYSHLQRNRSSGSDILHCHAVLEKNIPVSVFPLH